MIMTAVRPLLLKVFVIFIFTIALTYLLLLRDPSNKKSFGAIPRFKFNRLTKVYELEGKPIIWQFWHSVNVPLYIRLMIEAMQCRNPEFRTILVTEATMNEYLPAMEVYRGVFDRLSPQHRADIFRIAILQRYGGVYIDVDSFALDKIYPLYKLLNRYDVVAANEHNNRFAVGGIGPARARVSAFDVWHRNQLRKIKAVAPYVAMKGGRGSTKRRRVSRLFGPSQLLYGAMTGVEKEIASRRTVYLRYNSTLTIGQLVNRGLESAVRPWSDESAKFLPLNWAPYLLMHDLEMHATFWNMADISELMPETETVFSVFVGCALLDCWKQFEEMEKGGALNTPLGRLDVIEVMGNLRRMDRATCEKVRAEFKFDLEQYRE